MYFASGSLHLNGVNIEKGAHRSIAVTTTRLLLLCAILVSLATQTAAAAELHKNTAAAFDRYVDVSKERMDAELQNGPFLYINGLPEESRSEAYAQLAQGKILVRPAGANAGGDPIRIAGGLIHDWIGVVFIPHASLAQVLAVAQDYDAYKDIYKPEVSRSRLLHRDGDNFQVFLQFYKKSLVTVVLNADYEIHYKRLGPDRVVSYSYSTRLAEVENAGQADERELPVDGGHGYLWRLNSYWRLQAKDGGVYVQLESIGLSRGIPTIFAWLVNPLVRSIPRGSLTGLLGATRSFVVKANPTHP